MISEEQSFAEFFDLTQDNEGEVILDEYRLNDFDPSYENLLQSDITINDSFDSGYDVKENVLLGDVAIHNGAKKRKIESTGWRQTSISDWCKPNETNKSETDVENDLHKRRDRYICTNCGRIFNNKSSLVRHDIMVHRSKPSCPDCEQSFDALAQLEKHLEENSSELDLECAKCGIAFSNKADYKKHMDTNTCWIYFCEICGKLYRYDVLENHMKGHTGEELTCGICDKEFLLLGDLQRHKSCHMIDTFSESELRKFKKGNVYKCDICGRKIAQLKSFILHVRNHANHQCTHCNLAFSSKQALKDHVSGKHRFSCFACDLKFWSQEQLEQHKKSKTHAYRSKLKKFSSHEEALECGSAQDEAVECLKTLANWL